MLELILFAQRSSNFKKALHRMGHAFLVKQSKLKSSRFEFPSLSAFSCEEKDFHLDVKDGNCTIRGRFWPIEMCLGDMKRGAKKLLSDPACQTYWRGMLDNPHTAKWSAGQPGALSTKPNNPIGWFPAPSTILTRKKSTGWFVSASFHIWRVYESLDLFITLSSF